MSVLNAVLGSYIRRSSVLLSTRRWNTSGVNFEKKGGGSAFKSFTKYNKLNELSNEANFAKGSYLSNVGEKGQCWDLLHNSQKSLEKVHCSLDPLPVHDENYAKLIAEEIALVKTIRSLSFDFHLHDKVTHDSLKSFTLLTDQCLKAQVTCEKKVLTVYAIITVAGLALGMLMTFITSHVKEYFIREEFKTDESSEDLSEIISWIQRQNLKLKNCFQDLKNIIGPSLFLMDEGSLSKINLQPSSSESGMEVTDVLLQNREMLNEMLAMEFLISSVKKLKKLPELVALKDLDVEENKGLWITTAAYGVTAVMLPVILLLL